jgi:hypothetical protein
MVAVHASSPWMKPRLFPRSGPPRWVALDDALKALAEVDLRKSQVVELRFFGGLSVEEYRRSAQGLPVTVMRDW